MFFIKYLIGNVNFHLTRVHFITPLSIQSSNSEFDAVIYDIG